MSLEVGVDAGDARKTLDHILAYLRDTPLLLPGALAIRQTRQSSATLSIAGWPTTFTFEFALFGVKGIEAKLMDLLDALEAAGIRFRLNFGHIVGDANGKAWVQGQRLKDMFGAKNIKRWKKSRKRLCPSGDVFRSELTDAVGLT